MKRFISTSKNLSPVSAWPVIIYDRNGRTLTENAAGGEKLSVVHLRDANCRESKSIERAECIVLNIKASFFSSLFEISGESSCLYTASA